MTTDAIETPVKLHPVTDLFPRLTDQEYSNLRESIRENGCFAPVVFWKYESGEEVIDGRHRIEICTELGVPYPRKDYFGSEEEAIGMAWSLNEHRRHLTIEQRAIQGVKLAAMLSDAAAKRQRAGTLSHDCNKGRSTEKAAETVGISARTIQSAKKVIEQGSDSLNQAMAEGNVSIADAANIADEPKTIQNRAVKDVLSGNASTATQAVEQIKDRCDRSGKPWPKHLLPVVEVNRDLNKFRIAVADLVDESKVLGNGPMRTHIDWTPIMEMLERIRKTCLNGKPDYICPYCQGNGRAGERGTCKPCKGSGWVPERIWKDSPAADEVPDFKE